MNFRAQKQMQSCLDSLGTSLIVCWKPDSGQKAHGELKDKVLFIYDETEREAWDTFTHEVCEYKLQNVTRPYRLLVNSLIEVIEKTVYAEKEQFIEFLPKIMEIIKQAKGEGTS
jgi:hypothetical protein